MRLDIRPGHELDTLQLYGAVKQLGEQACHTAGGLLLYSRDTEESEREEIEQDEEGSSYPCYYLQYLEEMTIDLPMAACPTILDLLLYNYCVDGAPSALLSYNAPRASGRACKGTTLSCSTE